jgi:pimeloyl-ACP methyl ester carboxylesterase
MKKGLLLIVFALSIFATRSWCQINKGTSVKTGYVPVNGLEMYYEIHGAGEPIILLHGAYMTIGLNWAQLIPELSKSRKVIAVELQGHGRTGDIARPFSYAALASDITELMRHLNLKQADILGYSFGGTIALQLAITNPELINKLIIISTVFRYDGWLQEAREIFKTIKPEMFENTPLKTEYERIAPDANNWSKFVTKLAAFDREDFNLGEENLKSIKSPILFIMGDNDGVDLHHKATLYQLCGGNVFGDLAGLPTSRLAILPGATHVGIMMETEKLMTFIQAFLSYNSSSQH